MPFQSNFNAITQADLDNLDVDKKVVVGPWFSSILTEDSDSFYIPDGDASEYLFPVFENGYVSRVFGTITTGSVTGSAVSLNVATYLHGGGSGLGYPLTALTNSDDVYDSGALGPEDIPFTSTRSLALDWETDDSYTASGSVTLTFWMELTIPAS